jgi:SAM-dependent methyltransferase
MDAHADGVDVVRFWDEMAARYDGAYNSRTCAAYVGRARMAAVEALLGDGPGELLDAGMGPGRLLAHMAERGWEVAGVDASSEMVALARRRLSSARARLVEGEIESLPFPPESFDAVVATGVLEYVDYRTRALEELASVLRPGGLAVVSIPNRRALYVRWRGAVYCPLVRAIKRVIPVGRPNRPPGPEPPEPARFGRMLEAAGLRVEAVEHIGAPRVPAPLRLLFPATARRLEERRQRSRKPVGRRRAFQLVFAARRPQRA